MQVPSGLVAGQSTSNEDDQTVVRIRVAAAIYKSVMEGDHMKKISLLLLETHPTVKEQPSRVRLPIELENGAASRQLFMLATVIVLALATSHLVVAQTDPFLGTWKLNVNKSKFVPGPPRKSETRFVVSGSMGLNVSVQRVNGDGSTQQFQYTSNLDGKSYPIVGQGPWGANTIVATLTAPSTIQSILKKDSEVVATGISVVSQDGRVLTITTKGTDANGKAFNSVAVYDKQ